MRIKNLLLCVLCVDFFLACQHPVQVQEINDGQISELPTRHQKVILNFWATWCEPCVEEIPIFVQLQKQNQSVAVIGISLDEFKDKMKVQKFSTEHKMNYQIFLRKGGEDFEAMVNSIDRDWIGAVPATFIFKNGKRIFSKTGPVKKEELLHVLESTS